MILARWPRWQAIALVFVAQLLLIAIFGPVVLVPALIEEPFSLQPVGEYARYLGWIASLGWLEQWDDPETWIVLGMMIAWAGLAAAFVAPVVGQVETTTSGRSLWPSVIAAAAMGAFIAALLFAAVVEGLVALLTLDQAGFREAQETVAPRIWGGALATFINLVMGVAALFWLCGPWAVLLWTREARRNWSRGVCRSCGYPRRSGSAGCSECGAALG